jgi:hypothetical protein
MKTAIAYIHPAVASELAAIDWILSRLTKLLRTYPDRAADLAPRFDAALDERLRLMRVRDRHRDACYRSPNGSWLTVTTASK